MFTVWEFRSIDGKQVVRRIRQAHPDDLFYQHNFQKVIWRGENYQEAVKASQIKRD